MIKFPKSFFLILIFSSWCMEINAAGCTDNQSCTDLCGYAGAGECVNGNYCKCANCPQRSVYEATKLPNVCSYEPTCLCPDKTLTIGKVYTGHRCLHGTSEVCICFCLPTTVGGVAALIQCPIPKVNGTTISTSTSSTTIAPRG